MTDRSFQRGALLLALATWLLYAATATGSLSIDPNTRFTVAENFVRFGDVALETRSRLTVEHEGRHYSVFYPGQSLVFLPVAGAGVVARAAGLSEGIAFTTSRFVACVFLVPAFAVLAVLGHVTLLRRLAVRPRTTLAAGAVLAFATPLWVWGTNGSEETILAAVGVWSVVALLDAARRVGEDSAAAVVDRIGLAGWLLAIGVIHRTTFATVVLCVAIVGVPILLRSRAEIRQRRGRFTAWVLGGLVILAVVPLYNWARFGNPLDNGYTRFYEPFGGIFQTPPLVGVTGLLFSPGESVFLYAPWLLLLPLAVAWPAVRRRLGTLGWALAAAIVTHLLIYGMHTFWSGAFGWGVRFHVSLLPLVLVPIAVWIDTVRPGPVGRTALAGLLAVAVAVQVAGKALNMGLEHRQFPEQHAGFVEYEGIIPLDAAWTWRQSQWRLRFVNLRDKACGRDLLDLAEDDPARIRTVWNLFPIRAAAVLDYPPFLVGLWVLWGALVGLGVTTGVAAWRCGWRLEDDPPARA